METMVKKLIVKVNTPNGKRTLKLATDKLMNGVKAYASNIVESNILNWLISGK